MEILFVKNKMNIILKRESRTNPLNPKFDQQLRCSYSFGIVKFVWYISLLIHIISNVYY